MRSIGDSSLGGGLDVIVKWFALTWNYTEPPPTGLLTGFECVLFTGTDPTVTANYVRPIKQVLATDREWRDIYSYRHNAPIAGLNGAVRAVYPWGKSAWANVGVTVSPANPVNTAQISDNLILNPTSELGAIAGYGGVLVVNDAPNSYAGSYCRKLDSSATNNTPIGPPMACVYGDQFSFDAWVKGSTATPVAQLVLTFYNAAGAVVSTATSAAYTGSTTYQVTPSLVGVVPAGAVSVQASVQAGTTSASSFLYFDNLSLRRSTRFRHMELDAGFRGLNALKNTGTTINDRTYYAGNNDPTVKGGAPNISALTVTRRRWNSPGGTARLELKLQPTTASDNLDGMRPAKVQWYSQNYLPAATGSITASLTVASNCTVTRNSGGSGSFITDGFVVGQTLTMAGWANAANNITVTLVTVSATTFTFANASNVAETSRAGVTCTGNCTLSAIDTTYPQIQDRQFANSTDSNAANASLNTATLQDSGITGGYPACLVTLYNALGPSDTHCFYTKAGNGDSDGTALVDNGTSFPATFSGGASGGSGGGSGGGGGCPHPDVLVDCYDMSTHMVFQKRAGDVVVGDFVYTQYPGLDQSGPWPVIAVALEDNARWSIGVDGITGQFSFSIHHRFRIKDGGWCAIEDLQVGQVLDGTTPRAVTTAPAFVDNGPTVRITVDGAHAYCTSGVLSSNIKPN